MSLHGSEIMEVRYGEKVLHFDPIQHTYSLDTMPLKSVTTYLKESGYCHPWHGDGSAATLGRYVHEATALDDLDQLDMDTVDPRIATRVMGWRKFCRERKFIPDMQRAERPCFDPIYLVGGTPDRPGLLDGVASVGEIKTGQPAKWHALQCAAYVQMLGRHFKEYERAPSWIVYLKDDGDYDFVLLADRRLPALFAAIVACVNGKEFYADR